MPSLSCSAKRLVTGGSWFSKKSGIRGKRRHFPVKATAYSAHCSCRHGNLIGSPVLAAMPTSHRNNDAELGLAAQHSRVSLGRFFQRICFDHRAYAAQFGKAQCVLRVGWCSRGPALNRSTSADELYRCDLNGIKCRTDHHELSIWPQPVDQLGHRFRVWGRGQDDLCPAQLLQFLCCVRRFAVDVDARSELLCERRVLRPARDGRHLVTKLVCELHAEVPQTAETLHRNKVAGQGAAVPQRVESRDPGAEKRRCFGVA